MEQATNSFNKGLQMDTHPLVQGNDTLSDCLNGTFITMNGNEVILQNDMGNRRIDHAYLPAGYEPVGIKEHGGIIYLALYNPITHKGQVGSFPSPERRIGEENPGLGGKFELEDFINEGKQRFKIVEIKENETITHNIKYLKDDVLLIPLSNDTSLHAGDKFTVHSKYIWDTEKDGNGNDKLDENGNFNYLVGKYLTDFGHKDSKNNQFTLSLGVMNSQNEFIDITNSLQRFNKNDIISNPTDNTYGYFIQEEFSDPSETQDDNELLRQRNALAINTYAYKLVGPLYLKAELNHISTFSYNIEYEKFEESKNDQKQKYLRLYISGTFLYNCPDPSNNTLFDFYYKDGSEYKLAEFESDKSINIILNEEVNNLGLYSGEFLKIYKIPYNNELDIINYFLGVSAFTSDYSTNNDYYYIESLSDKGEIDISKVNSDLCSLIGYRFKNSINNNKIDTILTLEFECYPNKGTTFEDLSIQFTNVESKFSFTLPQDLYQSTIKTGKQNILISWDDIKIQESKMDSEGKTTTQDLKLKPKELYNVTISWEKKNNNDSISVTKSEERFFLSTELFNKCYESSDGENYVRDFKIFGNNYSGNSEEMILREKYLKISTKILNEAIIIPLQEEKETEGQLFHSVQNEVSISLYDYNTNEHLFTTMQFCDKPTDETLIDQYVADVYAVENNNCCLKVELNKKDNKQNYEIYKFEVQTITGNRTLDLYYWDGEKEIHTDIWKANSDTDPIDLKWLLSVARSESENYYFRISNLQIGDKIRIVGFITEKSQIETIKENDFWKYTQTNVHPLNIDYSNLKIGIDHINLYPSFISIKYDKLNLESKNPIISNNNINYEQKNWTQQLNSNCCSIESSSDYTSFLQKYIIKYKHYFEYNTIETSNIYIKNLYVDINSDLCREEMFVKHFSEIQNQGIDFNIAGSTDHVWKAYTAHCNSGSLGTGTWESWEEHQLVLLTCTDYRLVDGWGNSVSSLWQFLNNNCGNTKASIIKHEGGRKKYFFNPTSSVIINSDDYIYNHEWINSTVENVQHRSAILNNTEYIHIFLVDPNGHLVLLNNNSYHHPGLFRKTIDDYAEKEITKFLGTNKNNEPYVIPLSNTNIYEKIYYPSINKGGVYFYTKDYEYQIEFNINLSAEKLIVTNLKEEEDFSSYLKFYISDQQSSLNKKIIYNISSDNSFVEKIESLNSGGLINKNIYFNKEQEISEIANNSNLLIYKDNTLQNVSENCPLRYSYEREQKIIARWNQSSLIPNCGELCPIEEDGRELWTGALGIVYRDIPTINKTDLI